MKKIFLYIAITLGLLSCNHKDSLWQEIVEDLDERVETLEMLCEEMNTNITSLQTIVDVLQSNDFITSIVEIKKDGKVVGYTITFGKHAPITIYHGQDGKDGQNGTNGKDGQDGADGKDGQNGADGKDGITPVIGVAQDTDGVYYWTLNGEWLLDDNGNKLPVSGKDGVNGTDGKDGQDGADGKDGITPLLKIENGYWYISYDNGATWTESGKATGDNGQDGQNGTDGKDGQNGTNGQDGVTPLLKIENGYWYISYDNGATWAQLGKATGEDGKDGANGTNGTDGKDGQDGADGSNGQDGITPQLKIENGYWYVSYDNGATWTQFGKATGADGQDGQNGTDGKDGQDGKDGVTPQLKIEDGYWYISYDNGATWTQLGKATGEDGKDGADGKDGKDGQNGADGKDGQDGDSIFESVTEDDDYVYFTLSNGTIIKLPKGSGNQSSMGDGYVTSGKADGYYYVDLDLPSGTKWATCNVGSNLVAGPGYFFAWGETVRKSIYDETSYTLNISDIPTDIHLTEYDAATVNWGDKWATPTKEHWDELLRWANWTYTSYNEIMGWKVSGPNGNSIFLPAVGYSLGVKGFLYYMSSTFYGRGYDYDNKKYYDCIYCISNDNYEYTNTPKKDPTQLPELQYQISFHSGAGGPDWSGYSYDCLIYYYGYPIRPVLVEDE